MQMELLKKPLKSYRTIEIRETEEMLENSIIVPDIKPDIREILISDAECFVTNIERSGRMIEVSGEIRYRIMYSADTSEQRLESIVTQFSWSFSVTKPKTDAEIGLFAKAHCQHTEVSIVNGRKIVARSVCSLSCRFYEIKTFEIGREILGENVYVKNAPVNAVALTDNANITARVSNVLSLPHGSPAVKEILFSRVNIGSTELSFGEEEPFLEAKGTLYILYRSDTIEEAIESVVLQFPIKMETGVQSIAGGETLATCAIKNWEIDTAEDNDGLNTQVTISMEVDVDVQNLIQEEQVIIEDAYAIGCRLDLKKNPLNIITDERELRESIEVRHKIRIDDPDRRLTEVLMVSAREQNIASKLDEKNIMIQGTVGVDVVYSTTMMDINGAFIELPFTHSFALPSKGNWQIVQNSFNIEDVSFDITGNDTIEICIYMVVRVRIAKIEEIICTESISVSKDESDKKAPIVLYFAQPEDTLWSIAKEYRVPISRLALDNSIDATSKLDVGKKIFIM